MQCFIEKILLIWIKKTVESHQTDATQHTANKAISYLNHIWISTFDRYGKFFWSLINVYMRLPSIYVNLWCRHFLIWANIICQNMIANYELIFSRLLFHFDLLNRGIAKLWNETSLPFCVKKKLIFGRNQCTILVSCWICIYFKLISYLMLPLYQYQEVSVCVKSSH